MDRNVHCLIHKRPPPVPILSQISLVQEPHSTSWRSILILYSHLCLGLTSNLFPSSLSPKHTMHLILHVPPIPYYILQRTEGGRQVQVERTSDSETEIARLKHLFLRCEFLVHTRGIKIFMANCQYLFSELVWWPHVDKQEVLQLRAYIILFFYCMYI
jgi:hypothetical protein